MDKRLRDRLDRGTMPSQQAQVQPGVSPQQAARRQEMQAHMNGSKPAKKQKRAKYRTKNRFKSFIYTIGAILMLLVGAGIAYYVYLQHKMTISPTPAALTDTATPLPTEPFNLAIFGNDSRDPNASARADTVILARVDPVENRMWMVSIPRDTRVELPGHGASKINAAYAHGGSNMAIEAVEQVTGQEVNYFITLNFWGFADIVDAMDGVEVDVPIDINDPQGDITPDGSASVIYAGLQTLDGPHALTFVRHRDGYPDRDFGRMRAQQDFFRAIGRQITDVPVWRLPLVANAFADNTTTNFTPIELLMFARGLRAVSDDHLYLATLPGTWRSPFVHVDEAAAAEIWRKFGNEPFADE